MNSIEEVAATMRVICCVISPLFLLACSGIEEGRPANISDSQSVSKYIREGTRFCTPMAVLIPGVEPGQARQLCRCINEAAVKGVDARELRNLEITHEAVTRKMMENVDAAGARCRSEAGVPPAKAGFESEDRG